MRATTSAADTAEQSRSHLVAAPAVSLPKGGGAVRGLGEKFGANPVNGTGSLTIPIPTSPGRSGFGPQLALSYDSGSGNGPFGFGWNLSLPAVTRKTDKGLPRYCNEPSDIFVLSGAEDLVPKLEQTNAGEWVIEETTRTVDGIAYVVRDYRPRIEGLFARIECWTSRLDPADVFWRSLSPANITTWYGKTSNSRIVDPDRPAHIFSWLICESHDDKGGFKSRVSTAAYHDAHETLARFVGAETTTNTVVFGKNTTEAINKLAFRYPLGRHRVVLSTAMEHHSNDLPWRGRATVVRATVTPEGRVDEDDVDRLIAAYGERIALMTVSGASNVTGFVQPVHRLARKAHAVGANILVDAAQLASHRRIDVKPDDDPEHLDFVALSGHKMYAPFGTGVLVGRRDIFLQGAPEYQGGGTVDIVTPDEVHWAEPPDREEAGSPNVVGAVATAAAARALMDAGMENVERHEALLTTYALERLQSLPGISLYGESDPHRTHDRVGVIAFNLASIHHALVAAILGYEGGIGVRSGCFCAQPYVAHLLQRAEPDQAFWHRAIRDRDRSRRPGMVRISLGIYNTPEDIDALVEMLQQIARNDYKGTYGHVPQSGDCTPVGYEEVLPTRF